ncbi:LacI family DNA-binding transcriptional regulator [Kitasatospora sp. NPDC001683]
MGPSARTASDRDLFADGLRDQGVGELGYRPNATAVALRTHRSQVLGLLIRNLHNPFLLDVVDGFDGACAAAGYEVMIGSSRYDPSREWELLHAFQDRGVDGLAVAPIGTGPAVGDWAEAYRCPLVLLNAPPPQAGAAVMSVRGVGAAAVAQAVRHLVELGDRELTLVVAPADKDPEPERLERFRAPARESGFAARVVETELGLDAAREAVGRVSAEPPSRRPTAFLTNSDHLAQAVYLAAADLGWRVPEDLSVVGHDDLPTAGLLAPPLTTLRVDRREIGRRAATLLIDSLEGRPPARRDVVVRVDLRVRQPTSPADIANSQDRKPELPCRN